MDVMMISVWKSRLDPATRPLIVEKTHGVLRLLLTSQRVNEFYHALCNQIRHFAIWMSIGLSQRARDISTRAIEIDHPNPSPFEELPITANSTAAGVE